MPPKAGRAAGLSSRIRNASSTRYTPSGASATSVSNWAVRWRSASSLPRSDAAASRRTRASSSAAPTRATSSRAENGFTM